jgi:hypothetical protein
VRGFLQVPRSTWLAHPSRPPLPMTLMGPSHTPQRTSPDSSHTGRRAAAKRAPVLRRPTLWRPSLS